jgi:hypothetical protein
MNYVNIKNISAFSKLFPDHTHLRQCEKLMETGKIRKMICVFKNVRYIATDMFIYENKFPTFFPKVRSDGDAYTAWQKNMRNEI